MGADVELFGCKGSRTKSTRFLSPCASVRESATTPRHPDFAARKEYVPAWVTARRNAPAAFVFVAIGVALPFSSRNMETSPMGSPAEVRIVPPTVILTT
jgi:hypothetical protein